MKENTVTMEILIEQAMEAMRKLGFTEYSVQTLYGRSYVQMKTFFHRRGEATYSVGTMEEYRAFIDRRLADGDIGERHYKTLVRATKRIAEVYLTGRLECAIKTRISRFKLNDAFESIRLEYLSSREYGSSKAVRDYSWVIRKYLTYLSFPRG